MTQFDGQEVSSYKGKFQTPFDMGYADGSGIAYDDTVYFLVRARVGGSNHSTSKKTGELVRTNTFKVSEVQLMDDADITAAAVKAFMEDTSLEASDLFSFDYEDEEEDI